MNTIIGSNAKKNIYELKTKPASKYPINVIKPIIKPKTIGTEASLIKPIWLCSKYVYNRAIEAKIKAKAITIPPVTIASSSIS